jgi:mannose-6-phosphate isomerase-like protein (cupin superfamily)
MKTIVHLVLGAIVGSAVTVFVYVAFFSKTQTPIHRTPFQTNIVKATADNQDFRHVLFTGAKSQLVVMSIPPGGEVGQETHTYVEQTLYFQSGTGEAILDGKTTPIGPGDVVVVTPGTQHNFINTGKEPLQIFTTYAPPNHIDGRIQHTIADEKADTADEAFGQAVR